MRASEREICRRGRKKHTLGSILRCRTRFCGVRKSKLYVGWLSCLKRATFQITTQLFALLWISSITPTCMHAKFSRVQCLRGGVQHNAPVSIEKDNLPVTTSSWYYCQKQSLCSRCRNCQIPGTEHNSSTAPERTHKCPT